jgi:hypothetical protein
VPLACCCPTPILYASRSDGSRVARTTNPILSPSNQQRITWRPKNEDTPAPNCTSTHLTSFDIAPGHGTAVQRPGCGSTERGVAEAVGYAVSPSGYRQ